MASTIALIPRVCNCGAHIGRLQKEFEEHENYGDVSQVFQKQPKMCCLRHVLAGATFIPNNSHEFRYIDARGSTEIVVPTRTFKPRNLLVSIPEI